MNTRARRIEPLEDWSAVLIFCDQDDSDMIDCKIVDISASGCRLNHIEYKPYPGQLVYYIFTSENGIFTLRAKVVKIFDSPGFSESTQYADIAIHFENATDAVGEFKQSDIDSFLEFITFHAPGEETWDEENASSIRSVAEETTTTSSHFDA